MAVLLPMQCAIGNSSEIQYFKKRMLEENTLDAVFTLPMEVFYPGASVAACCMVFTLGQRHENSSVPTFFGYYKDDGLVKKKNLGRIERYPGSWSEKEQEWLKLYFNRQTKKGLSVTKYVTAEDEWLAEAYMETDYTNLISSAFQKTINDYLSFKVKVGGIYDN